MMSNKTVMYSSFKFIAKRMSLSDWMSVLDDLGNFDYTIWDGDWNGDEVIGLLFFTWACTLKTYQGILDALLSKKIGTAPSIFISPSNQSGFQHIKERSSWKYYGRLAGYSDKFPVVSTSSLVTANVVSVLDEVVYWCISISSQEYMVSSDKPSSVMEASLVSTFGLVLRNCKSELEAYEYATTCVCYYDNYIYALVGGIVLKFLVSYKV